VSASIDYTGRTVDLLIFQGVQASGNHLIETGFGEAGFVCTGIQKVAQTWLTLFMTDRGSVMNKPTRGSTFLPAVRRGRIQVEGDVPAEFALAAEQVSRTMELDAVDDGTLPDDERLDEAVLLDFDLFRELSQLRLKVRIRSIAGDARVIFLPVPVPIR
jgi:hypothetical protein